MSTQVVELSGDEANLLRALDKVIQKEREHERSLARMGDAGDQAGLQLEDAMARVQKANDDAIKQTIKQLGQLGPEGKRAAELLKAGFKEVGKGGFEGPDGLLKRIEALDPATAEVVAGVRAKLSTIDEDEFFTNTIGQMKSLGGVSAAVAEAIQANLKAAAADDGAFDRYVADLEKLDPKAREIANQVKARFAEADRQTEFDETMKSLRQLGPEGEAIAKAFGDQMKTAAASANGSLETIVDKLKQFDPSIEELATKIKTELAAADAATKFDDSIRELEKINPTAAAAAKKVREEMDLADADVKFDNIIAELEKVDPAAAFQAKKLRGYMKTTAEDGEKSWKNFATSSVAQIGLLAGAYLGVEDAIAMVNNYLQEQIDLIEKASGLQLTLAAAQADALKKVPDYNKAEQRELIEVAPKEIADKTGFSNEPMLVKALGQVAGQSDLQTAKKVVEASAAININSPEDVEDTAIGTLKVMRNAKINDPQVALSLIQSFDKLSEMKDFDKIVENLPKAVLNGVNTVPTQDSLQATRQSAAIFAAANKYGGDIRGDTSASFQTTLMTKMNEVFSGLEDRQIEARSDVEKFDRKISAGKDTEEDRRDRERKLEFLSNTEGLVDPGTIFGRLELIQQKEGLKREFLGSEGYFGEGQFRTFLSQLVDANSSAAKDIRKGFDEVVASPEAFQSQVESSQNATAALRGASFVSKGEANARNFDSRNKEGTRLFDLRNVVLDALVRGRQTGFSGFIDSTMDQGVQIPMLGKVGGIEKGSLEASTYAEEAVDAMSVLRGRIGSLHADGVTEEEKNKISVLTKSMQDIQATLVSDAESGDFSRTSFASAEAMARERENMFARQGQSGEAKFYADLAKQIADALKRQNDLMEENNNLLADTAANTAPGPTPTPDYDGVSRGAAAQEDSR